jgi:hypothetical protein
MTAVAAVAAGLALLTWPALRTITTTATSVERSRAFADGDDEELLDPGDGEDPPDRRVGVVEHLG